MVYISVISDVSGSPKQWKSEKRNFIVWNSEIIGFDSTEKSVYSTEKHKRNLVIFFCYTTIQIWGVGWGGCMAE